jgi:hypothetical protein
VHLLIWKTVACLKSAKFLGNCIRFAFASFLGVPSSLHQHKKMPITTLRYYLSIYLKCSQVERTSRYSMWNFWVHLTSVRLNFKCVRQTICHCQKKIDVQISSLRNYVRSTILSFYSIVVTICHVISCHAAFLRAIGFGSFVWVVFISSS